MEKGSGVGIVLVIIGTFVGAVMKGVSPAALFSVPAAFLIVLVSSFGATFLSFGADEMKNLPKYMKIAFMPGPPPEPGKVIGQIVEFADRARREGLLALEDAHQQAEEPFLRKGLQMAVDGAESEVVRDTLDTEVHAMKERHKLGSQFMTQLGIYAPTFGIIGAVFGLIATLANLDDPEKLGHGIAAAFVATFWGVFVGQRHLPADRPQAPAPLADGGRVQAADHRGRAVDPGRLQPPGGRRPAPVVPPAGGAPQAQAATATSARARSGTAMSRKKHDDHEEHVNHEAWVIPYADLMTLLMGLFLVLWSLGKTDAASAEQVAGRLRRRAGHRALRRRARRAAPRPGRRPRRTPSPRSPTCRPRWATPRPSSCQADLRAAAIRRRARGPRAGPPADPARSSTCGA